MNDVHLVNGVVLKPIASAPNADYMAGSDGMIYSRTKYKGFGRREYVDWYPLAGHSSGKGYKTVSMCHNNRKITKSVHRLVCEAFHGTPKQGDQTRHLDGNTGNNLPENLKWGTQEENWEDRKKHGSGTKGENHPLAKLTNEEANHLRWALLMSLCSQRHAAKVLGLSQAGIWHVVHGRQE